ncbi:hypothetical protein SK128_015159 [Halocaridina rubra]|uniref:LisH domain-containing protein n=1 Tax=Halocaridina rubra TaxID=373956 RepID=A0AAN9ABQ2_HALRR
MADGDPVEDVLKEEKTTLPTPSSETKKRERSSASTSVPWDDIAAKLLQEKLLLTALELHTELTEAGYELPRLRDYFSNPANFEKFASKSYTDLQSSSVPAGTPLARSTSQTTLDSLDWGHLSEDGERAVDERIAVLEFELRKARETIQGLRTNLTQATEAKPVCLGIQEADKDVFVVSLSSIRPHEKRTLNYLINEYLVTNSYKLTAITFADENDDQDFEHWDDVGLNIGRPPNLAQLLRGSGHSLTQHNSCACQTDPPDEDRNLYKHYEDQILSLQMEVQELTRKCDSQERELQYMKRKSSTPYVTPLHTPNKPSESRLGDNNNYTDMRNPIAMEAIGRESPEGTSDNEETSGGGGFVMVNTSSTPPQVHIGNVPTDNIDDCGTQKLLHDSSLDVVHSERVDLEEPLIGGFDDPADSIEALIQATSEAVQEVSERLGEAIDNKSEMDDVRTSTPDENVQDSLSVNDVIPTLDEITLGPDVVDVHVGEDANGQKTIDEYLAKLKSEAQKLLRVSSKRHPPESFEERILQSSLHHTIHKKSRVQVEVATLGQGGRDLLDVVVSSLHNISPNVILAKREELLPLLIYGVSLHKDAKERERLLHLLFNLIKRPNEDQRNAILTGLVGLARILGANKLEGELLPQCWEQLTHKYVERRLLVAQSTAALSPYTPPPLRNSLLLSMLLQLLAPGGEKELSVREAALISLSLLVTYLDDKDKIPILVETLIYCLEHVNGNSDGPNASVDISYMKRPPTYSSGTDHLLTSLGIWTVEMNSLNLLLSPLLVKLSHLTSNMKQQLESQVSQNHTHQSVVALVDALIKIIPYILANLINTMPLGEEEENVSVLPVSCSAVEELSIIMGSKTNAEAALNKLHKYLAKEWYKSWNEYEYISKSFIPDLVDILCMLDASVELVIQSFIKLFCELNVCLGQHTTSSCITPVFLKHLTIDEGGLELVREGKTGLTGSLVIVYTVALLASSQGSAERQEELEGFLTRQISILALCRAQLDSLYVTISSLLLSPRNQESVLGALWSCVVHKSSMVRKCSAGLWGIVVECVEDAALGTRVIPALVTLATDPDISVRASAVHPLAVVITTSTNSEVLDKVWLQLETLCDDPSITDNLDFQLALVRACTALAHSSHPRLIHEFLLPRMCRMAMDGRHSEEDWSILGLSLLQAYSTLTCCHLPDHVIAHFVLPPMHQLQKTMGSATFEHMETITDLIKEYNLRTQSSQGVERRKTNISLTGALPVHPGMDDMKNRMSKMFAARPSTNVLQAKASAINASLPGFWKKK